MSLTEKTQLEDNAFTKVSLMLEKSTKDQYHVVGTTDFISNNNVIKSHSKPGLFKFFHMMVFCDTKTGSWASIIKRMLLQN